MRRTLFSVRMAGWLGGTAGWAIIIGFVVAVAAAGAWLVTEYRLREAENALSSLLDGTHYRYLSAASITAAAPRWAEAEGVFTKPEWVRVRITDQGVPPTSAASTELERALADAGALLGRRGAEARVQVAARLVVGAHFFPFTRYRRIEGEAGTEREAEYQTTGASEPWDDLADPSGLGDTVASTPKGLPPLPSPTAPTLAALDAWRDAERALARSLGRKTLAAAAGQSGLPVGPDPQLARTADTLARFRAEVAQYVHEPARDELIDWLGREGAEALEAATATMVHLDVLLRAAALERPTVGPLLGPYVARAEAARNSLGEALGRVGVLVP